MRHDYVLVDAMPYFPSVGENLIVHSGIGDRLDRNSCRYAVGRRARSSWLSLNRFNIFHCGHSCSKQLL